MYSINAAFREIIVTQHAPRDTHVVQMTTDAINKGNIRKVHGAESMGT
jgi:hypothetical protein